MKRTTIFAAALSLWAAAACAAEPQAFTQHTFDQLARDGRPVVVDVSAAWCPTCKAQKPIVDSLSRQPAYKDVAILSVDFDADRATLRQLRVNMQSTLIAFKGGKERARSIGDTTPAGIESIFKMAAN